MKRSLSWLPRNLLRASTLLAGVTMGFATLGHAPLAIVAAALTCLLALTAFRILTRTGDR
ncbi:hypothetical protein [Sphingomonas lacusdianchii]|uniref:hypothetical protein n=1 Tax=Sphingomonas lacusdianchii TaxID=2917992 RepID=UPI001F5AF0ED|nr:hypothetical protein [Sphingomonas sp. JXJ CY 53]